MHRSFVALLTAVLVFVLTYLSAWVAMRNNPFMTLGNHPLCWTMCKMHRIDETLSEYAKKNGHYPESLEELTKSQESDSYLRQDAAVTDPWEHPFQYEKTQSGYRLYSFGFDGKSGGVGIYADLECDERGMGKWPVSTPYQFVFETVASSTLFFVALATSCFAGLIWYVRKKPAEGEHLSKVRLTTSIIFTTISAVAVAWFLTAYYLIVQQSGH